MSTFSLSVGFMRDKMHFLHVDVGTSTSTNKTSDQKLVALLNSGYQLLDYIINERLKRIVEQANVLKPGQSGGRQASFVELKDGTIHGGPTLACSVNDFLIFYLPTLARSKIPHPTSSSIAHWGTCPGLAAVPCLVLDSSERTLQFFDW